jgi:hypothetical protein
MRHSLVLLEENVICTFQTTLSPKNPFDFYLHGTIRQKVYRSNLHTIETLNENIRREVYSISPKRTSVGKSNFHEVARNACRKPESIFCFCCYLGKFYL